ncbi:MAG: AAA family ATPase [Arcicella sp.]|nr:AAA family ATPase [Arcicella sp.]
MKIVSIEIQNYRNLSGQRASLHHECNFIVGENNIGKSNFLNFINVVFTQRGFNADDFKDLTLPIRGKIVLQLEDVEKGIFSDLFDADDPNKVNILLKQQSPIDNLEFNHEESLTFIQPSLIRCLNYIHYDSLRNPISEINFDKGKGVGKFLTRLVKNYVSTQSDINLPKKNFVNETEVNLLVDSLNNTVGKLKAFNDFGIKAGVENDLEALLPKMVSLVDINGDSLTRSGYGVQFLILVTLSILDKIQTIVEQKWRQNAIFEGEENVGGKTEKVKYISLVLGLDEPEIHLHPYMQRSLIKYLNRVISNQNQDFNDLLKSLFGIDKFIGQIIVVTHSPNIILNDYKQIIRLNKNSNIVNIISGMEISLSDQHHKHFQIQFSFIKEAFFCKSVILIEGDTEYACLPLFANKLHIDFDDLGISIIQTRGDSIGILLEVMDKFNIPSVGIEDADNGGKTSNHSEHYYTNCRDFEEELIDKLINCGNELIIKKILCAFDKVGLERKLEMSPLNKRGRIKYKLSIPEITRDYKLSEIISTENILLKCYYLTWFDINKGLMLGTMIGSHLENLEIPRPYVNLINKAVELSKIA